MRRIWQNCLSASVMLFVSSLAPAIHAGETKELANIAQIAFLEDAPIVDATIDVSKQIPRYRSQVRSVFFTEGSEWKTCPSLPPPALRSMPVAEEMYGETWIWATQPIGGRSGRVISREIKRYSSWRDFGTQEIISIDPWVLDKPRDNQFSLDDSNWPVHRPVLLLSAQQAASRRTTYRWKIKKANGPVPTAILDLMKKHVMDIDRHTALSPVDSLNNNDIRITDRIQSNRGDTVYGLQFKNSDVQNLIAEPDVARYWFAHFNDDSVAFLGGGMQLITAMDCDGDGEEEMLFLYSLHDCGGYRIFWDRLKKHSSYEWIYRG